MTANADILKKLRADVAAAKSGLSECTCQAKGPMAFCQGCKAALERSAARARLAAFDGPALLEALVRMREVYYVAAGDHDDGCTSVHTETGTCDCGKDAIADCAKALEVSDA